MKSAAAIVLGLAATACSHDFDVVEKVEQQSIDNAQQTLGFYIPENQDWKMSSEASVNVTIPGDASQTYTVMIFSNNPLEDGVGYYLTKQTLKGGQNLATDVAYPMHLRSLVIGITDSNGKTIYKSASIDNGKVTALNEINAARTRTVPEGFHEGYVGEYADANEWAAEGYNVPDPLTDGQKLRVQYYFQMNKITDPYRPDYGQIDFFMQQVYDGVTDPMTKYKTDTDANGKYIYSTEVYKSADNGNIDSGDHMDHLTAGPDHTHVNNFNNSNCGWNYDVLDNNQPIGGTKHADQIMLMINTKTSCFGYANSEDSYVRDDRWTLVGAKQIDDFCDNNGFTEWLAEWNTKNNKNVKDDKKVDDDWHRGFIGFDFDQLPDYRTFASSNIVRDEKGKVTSYDKKYVQMSEFPDQNNVHYAWDGTNVSAIPTGWLIVDDKQVPYANSDMNQYCGDVIGCSDNHNEITETADYVAGGENNTSIYINVNYNGTTVKALNMKFINKRVRDGYIPVDSKSLRLWVKVGGCNDGYFSDWIVSFKPATSNVIIIDHDPAVWSYAFEDNRVRCDFDMNDVVLRVNVNKTDPTKFDVTLVAAGCEYDNYVFLGGQVITWPNGKTEVHDALGAAKGQMVNTGRGVTKPSVTTTVSIPSGDTAENAHFSIWPYKKGGEYGNVEDQKEEAAIGISTFEGKGKAPLGIVVPGKWAWPKERICIVDAYSRFVQWASSVTHITGPTEDEGGWYDYPTTDQVIVMP